MNQTNTGTSNGCSTITNVFAVSKKKANAKTSRFSTSVVMFGSMLMLALQLLSGSANAVNIPVTSFTCTQTMTATTTCVGNGFFASGWNSGTGYWQYQLNTLGYSGAITMTFSNTKSSAAGPTSGQVYYNIGAGDVAVTGGAFAVSTSCTPQTITLPAVCAGVSNLIVKVKMLGATASTATHRITAQNVFDAASAGCSGTPAAGTVSAGTNPLCGGLSTTLSLTGSAAGVGITYQWQSSPNNTTWTPISGATSLSYTATPAASTYYRVVTTCTNGATVTNSNSPSLLLTVNNVAISAITVPTNPLTVGNTETVSSSPTGGLWLSSDPSVASISASGVLTGNFGGSTVVTYQVTDFTTGCVGNKTANVNVIWPNTIALYAGVNGNSTNVINVPGDVTSTLYNVGFGAATPCTSGGFSGITVPVTDTVADATAPHVGYKVYATAGHDLNFYRIHAGARVSGTGPTKARIAFRTWQGGSTLGWNFEAADQALTSGSCGSSANSWDFNTGNPVNPNPTFNGIDSMEVAVFPFAPGASTGTFQLNSLEVYGLISGDTDCTVVNAPADSVLPAIVNICDSGKRFLNYNIGSGGVAGFDILYQWQVSTDGVTYTNIPGAEGVVYQTPMLNTSSPSDTFYYRVMVTCDNSGAFNYSVPNIVTIHGTPSGAGTITGALSSTNLPFDHMLIGSTYTMSSTVAGGTWSSNDTSVISINPTSGLATPNIQGDAIITYRAAVGGCFGSSKDTVVAYHPNTKVLYVGQNGSSVNLYKAAGTNATDLSLLNWGSSTTCANGGVSGLTNTTTAQSQSTNGEAFTRVIATATPNTFNATKVIATVRDQNSGTYQAYLGYKAVGAPLWTIDAAGPIDVDADDCGYSHSELTFTFPASVSVGTSGVDFAVFGYNGTATTTLQINSLSVIGDGSALMNGVGQLAANTDVRLYPNPVENTLNVAASQNVNVVIMSIDGKKLLEQKNATNINVSNLMSGMYLIQVYDEANKTLLKTEKFIKK